MARLGPSYVDESLFGNPKKSRSRMGRSGARIAGNQADPASDPIRITRAEWERIKGTCCLKKNTHTHTQTDKNLGDFLGLGLELALVLLVFN